MTPTIDLDLATLLTVAPTEWDGVTFDDVAPGHKHLYPIVCELFILTKERGLVRLGDVMNHAQRQFVLKCEDQLNTTGRIRACVLKARQIGMSTVIEAIIFSLSVMNDHLNSLIISHEKDSAEALLGMTNRYWESYIFRDFHTAKYTGKTRLSWADTGSNVQVATAKNVNAGRSRTIHCLHASEVAFYDDPDTLMTGLRQTIPTRGLSAVFYESTANGVGNFFHRMCVQAMQGASEYIFHFFPWHEHPEYRADYLPEVEAAKFFTLEDLTEEERKLRKMGIPDDRLIWRRYAIENLCGGDIDKFHQEYPTTPHEAFVSTGRNVFSLPDLLVHYEPRHGKRGRLIVRNGRPTFVEDRDGYLTVYSTPSRDTSWGVYLIGADPTSTVIGDNASAQVINRRTKEQVAVYSRKVDPVQFGKDLQMLGSWYHGALVAPEREGPGYATVGCMAGDGYVNLYQGQNIISAKGHTADALGWSTNGATKHLAIQHLKRAVTEPIVEIGSSRYGLVIHHEQTLAELRDYVTDEKGTGYENSGRSKHDDNVMALAIAVTVDALEMAPPPYEVAQTGDKDFQRPITRVETGEDEWGRETIIAVDPTDHSDKQSSDTEAPVVPWEQWGDARDQWEKT